MKDHKNTNTENKNNFIGSKPNLSMYILLTMVVIILIGIF